jgi:hypothetical protein
MTLKAVFHRSLQQKVQVKYLVYHLSYIFWILPPCCLVLKATDFEPEHADAGIHRRHIPGSTMRLH